MLLAALVVVLALIDVFQTRHAVRRNFPLIGRLRYLLEWVGPELRQYIVTDNDEERPFSRDQRRWVYASAKLENSYFGFGTDSKFDASQYPLIRQATFPFSGAQPPQSAIPCVKVMGEWRDRKLAFRPPSIVNISAMSFGSLSGAAIEALNRGSAIAGCLHNTGEGGVSSHHRHGGDLVLQLGTGYFGARDASGKFSLDRLVETCAVDPVRAIEVKLSQGAKPGLGGVLPAAKVTPEIAKARGVPVGITVVSPPSHAEFDSVPSMVDFVERLADATGLPVGIKSAVGQKPFWQELANHMLASGKGPDFISIDGGEGGTGAAPLVFSDHVSLPFRLGFAEVFAVFANTGMHEKVVWVGAGKLGFPGEALLAMGLGVDLISVGREAMMAVGCIQAQKCHTGHCPTGVATQVKWLERGLDPTGKADRLANYVIALRHEILRLAHACGEPHPALVTGDNIELLVEGDMTVGLWERFGYKPGWHQGCSDRADEIAALMAPTASGTSS